MLSAIRSITCNPPCQDTLGGTDTCESVGLKQNNDTAMETRVSSVSLVSGKLGSHSFLSSVGARNLPLFDPDINHHLKFPLTSP